MSMIQGVDVHAGYGVIDWATASNYVRFAYVKCTTGNDPGVDEQFHNNVLGCRSNNILVGGYHFAEPLPDDGIHPHRNPEDQAEIAFRESLGLGSQQGDLPHMLDAEWPLPENLKKWGCSWPQINDWLRRYCEHWTLIAVRKPIIYIYPWWWKLLADTCDVSWANNYEVMFADYGWLGEGVPTDDWAAPHWSWVECRPWQDWTICQYSANGSFAKIPGIHACPIDRDCVRNEDTLTYLINR